MFKELLHCIIVILLSILSINILCETFYFFVYEKPDYFYVLEDNPEKSILHNYNIIK